MDKNLRQKEKERNKNMLLDLIEKYSYLINNDFQEIQTLAESAASICIQLYNKYDVVFTPFMLNSSDFLLKDNDFLLYGITKIEYDKGTNENVRIWTPITFTIHDIIQREITGKIFYSEAQT